MSRLASERGQSTLEYVAVIGVVAVLAAVAGAAAMAPTYFNATTGGFQKALCIVTGRACRALDEQPCVVRSKAKEHGFTASIVFVRLRDGRRVLQERLSDGRIRITVTSKDGIGAEAGIGVEAGVDYKGLRLGGSLEANASVLGLFGRGKVYVARDAGEAQRLLRAIDDGSARAPDATFHEGGAETKASASAGAGASLGGVVSQGKGGEGAEDDGEGGKSADISTSPLAEAKAELGLATSQAVGRRVDRRTGETTYYLRGSMSASASAGASAGVPGGAKAEAKGEADARFGGLLSITTDRRGRVVSVGALRTTSAEAGYEVSGGPEGKVGGRRQELEVTADPSDPAIAAALAQVRRRPGGHALVALSQAIFERGRVDRRTYDVVDQDHDELSGSIAAGAKVGLGYEQGSERLRLVSAETRPPGGVWERRFDCVAA